MHTYIVASLKLQRIRIIKMHYNVLKHCKCEQHNSRWLWWNVKNLLNMLKESEYIVRHEWWWQPSVKAVNALCGQVKNVCLRVCVCTQQYTIGALKAIESSGRLWKICAYLWPPQRMSNHSLGAVKQRLRIRTCART